MLGNGTAAGVIVFNAESLVPLRYVSAVLIGMSPKQGNMDCNLTMAIGREDADEKGHRPFKTKTVACKVNRCLMATYPRSLRLRKSSDSVWNGEFSLVHQMASAVKQIDEAHEDPPTNEVVSPTPEVAPRDN